MILLLQWALYTLAAFVAIVVVLSAVAAVKRTAAPPPPPPPPAEDVGEDMDQVDAISVARDALAVAQSALDAATKDAAANDPEDEEDR